MEKLILELPRMYGDHHVTEIRRILLELPGIADVYASSCFHTVEVTFDPAQLEAETIKDTLDDAGYLGDLELPIEVGMAVYGRSGGNKSFRHTQVIEQAQKVRFSHRVTNGSHTLWHCPGLGVINASLEETEL